MGWGNAGFESRKVTYGTAPAITDVKRFVCPSRRKMDFLPPSQTRRQGSLFLTKCLLTLYLLDVTQNFINSTVTVEFIELIDLNQSNRFIKIR